MPAAGSKETAPPGRFIPGTPINILIELPKVSMATNRVKARPMSCEAMLSGQCRAVYGQVQGYLMPGVAYEPGVGWGDRHGWFRGIDQAGIRAGCGRGYRRPRARLGDGYRQG